MALTKLPGYTLDTTKNFTFANANVTGNINTGNANLGNAATANFFIGNGSLLTGLAAGYANSNVASYLPTYAGNITFANAAATGDIIPTANVMYSLGNATNMWKDVYVGPGSLYVNGVKVLEQVSTTMIFSADVNQNIRINTSGTGDIELLPAGTGKIAVKGALQIQSNVNVTTNDGNAVNFSVPILVDSITSKTANSDLILTAAGTGSVKVADDFVVTGNLTVQGVASILSVTSLSVEDNIIDISAETTGAPSNNAGIRVVRGDEAAVQIRWNETTDTWQFTNDGSVYSNLGAGSSYANSNVASYLPTYTGNLTAGNISTAGVLTAGDTTVTGNLTVSGTTVTANVTTIVVKDPIIEQGGNTAGALTTNDGKDRGQLLHYYTTVPVDAFMGWDNSNAEFAFASNASVSGEVATFNSFGNVRANFFIGNGSALTDIAGANVTSAVGLATYATTANSVAGANVSGTVSSATYAATANAVAGANVTGAVSLATYATTANAVAGANVSGQVANALISGTVYTNAQPNITSTGTLSSLAVTGNISAGNASLGNAATASYFIGDGSLLTNLPSSGAAASATVTANAQPNITSTGTLVNLAVSGNVTFTGANVSLGSTSNLHITGGTANYYLKTDGAGNLTWASAPTSTIVTDVFTGNGVQTSFTLSTTPEGKEYTTVNLNGATLLRTSYILSGGTIILNEAPDSTSDIEVTTVSTLVGTGGYGNNNVKTFLTAIDGNIVPAANVTYDLGSPTSRWKDLYLSSNTLHLGDTSISAADILPIDLDILPEVLAIQVAAPDPGDDTTWLWTWETSTLPFARTTITNSPQTNVPLYKQGTYQINNFANQQTGVMTQRHLAYLKWIDGSGVDNVVSWAVDAGNVSMSNPNINGGATTTVQRINVTVPSTVTPPTLTAPTVSYDISFANVGAYTIGGAAEGDNLNLGPMYKGGTYTFNLASSISSHPFYLTTDNGTNFVANTYFGEYTSGVTGSRNDGTTGKTTLTFVVGAGAPSTLYYQCGVHASMRGAITIKDLAVETNVNGNYVLYFQHDHEGHKTPVEIRPLPSLVNQMCVVYDQTTGKFVPQDLATYVENTPSFKNKIREVAGTATLVAADGVAVVPTVSIVEDASYLPLVGNKDGDITYAQDTETLYIWNNNNWTSTKAAAVEPGLSASSKARITGYNLIFGG